MSNSSTTIRRSAALSLALFLCAGMLVHAATWYVRTTGSDANNGTSDGTAFATIQKAINEAANGDVIDVGAGTFAPATTITVNKEVTIDGAGEGTTIIDVGGFNAWGIYITANNVTIKDLTVEGDATVNQQFTVKIGTGGPASGTNTVAEDFSLENVTITNVRRTGLDLNGVDGATITNVTVSNVTNGFGMSISSSHNVTVNGLTTNNCAWGDVGVFPANTAYQWNTTLDGPDNIVFTGTLSLGAGSISVQDGALSNARGTWVGTISNNAADNANVTVPASFSHVVNANRSGGLVLHNVGTESTIKTLAATLAAATTPFTFSNITINDLDNDEWDVVPGLSIQTAVNAATSGDVVNVSAGTYNEVVEVDKGLSIRGANYGVNPNTGTRGSESTINFDGDFAVEIFASNVTFDGFSVNNTTGNAVRIAVGRQNVNSTANVSNVTVRNNIASGTAIKSYPGGDDNSWLGVMSFDNFEQAQYTASDIVFTDNKITVNGNWGRGITFGVFNGAVLTGTIDVTNNHIATTGSPSNVVGLELRNGTGFSSMQGVTITGNTFDGFDMGAVWPRWWPTTPTISGNTFLNNVHDIRLSSGSNTVGANTFSGSTSAIWNDTHQNHNISSSATGSTFNGITLNSSTSLADLYAIEDKIKHKLDDGTLGFVRVKSGEVFVTTNSASVQRGVDAATAGDVVNVQAGTYTSTTGQSVARINKTLTLRGANVGKAGSDPTRGAESIITGGTSSTSANLYVVDIKANDVILDGFEITHPNYTVGGDADLSGILVGGYEGGLVQWTGVQIKNNLIHDIGSPSWSMSSGSSRQGINVGPVDGITISDNKIYDIGGTNGTYCYAVTAWGDSDGTPSTNVTITNNAISNITSTGSTTDDRARGVALNYKSGAATVSNNTISGVQMGVATSANAAPAAVVVSGNDITATGAGVWARSPHALTVENNTITGATDGVRVRTGAGVSGDITITNNDLAGNTTAILNSSAAGVIATCNWFGSNDATVVGGKISGAVSAIPYLTSVDPADYTSPGFTPSGACNGTGPVSSDDPVGQYFTIQSAIDGSNAGATVTASAGTYAEAVALNKGVTVTGTGATITGLVTISNENAVLTDMTLAGTPIALTFTTDIDSYTLGTGNTFDAACTTFVETVAGNNITLPAGTDLGGLTDNYLIEDKINHALDAGGLGIVRWNGNNLYVTSNSGSIQRAIDAASSSDAINIDAVTFNENPVLHKNIVLNSLTSTARRLGTNNYFVFGTTGLSTSNFSGFTAGEFDKIGVNTNGTVSEAITAVNTSGTVLLTTEVQSSGTAEAEFDAFTFTNKNITIEGNGTTGSNCDVQPVISINGENSVALTSEGDANRTLKNVTLMINASTGANFVRVTNGSIGDITVEDVRFQRGGQDITGLQPLTTPSALADGKDIPEFLQDGADVGFGPGKVLFGQGAPFGASSVVAAWKGSDANSNSVQTVYSYSTTSLNLSQTFLTRRPSRSVNNGDFNDNTVIGIPTSGNRMLQAIASSDVIAGDEKTVFVVFRTPLASNTDRVIYKHGDHLSGISIIYDDQENVQFNIFNNRTPNVGTFETFETAVAPNTVAIAQLYFDGTSTTNRVGAALDWGSSDHWEIFADDDDFSATSLSAPTLNLTSAINVGALSQGKTYFEGAAQTRSTPGFTLKGGFIAEVIVLNTADASIRNDVYCYLHRKYDLGNNNNGLERAIPVYDYEEEILAGQSNTVWPNPASDRTSVAFTVPEPQFVTITLVDALGRPVANVASEYMMAGEQIYDITLDTIPSGLYTVAINGFTFNTSAPVMVRK